MEMICPHCHRQKRVFTSKQQRSFGRRFAKCTACDSGFVWLDETKETSCRAQNAEGQRSETVKSSSAPTANANAVTRSTTAPAAELGLSGETEDQSESSLNGLSFLTASSVSDDEPGPVKEFIPSPYQQAIFDFVRNESGNALIEAVAGSGKSTTLVESLKFTPSDLDVGFVAFNKHIATELQKRAPDHVHVSTLHSLGFANIRKAFGKVEVDDRKLWNIFHELTDSLPEMVKSELQDDASAMIRLVNLCKGTMREPVDENLEWLCDRYGIEVNGNRDDVFEWTSRLHDKSREQVRVIDYEDMIDFCAVGKVPCQKFDALFIDEGQDLNQAQIAMSLKSGSRIVVVADRKQSIYGFRGADTEAVPNMIEATKATLLPLSICYRCPKSVVELAKTIVPQIEWRDGAPDGLIANITEDQFFPRLRAGDLVLCRTNAPLVRPCFDLIRRGTKATIRGRDIGNGLIQLLEKHAKKIYDQRMTFVLASLSEYVDRECAKLLAANRGTRAQSLQDQLETLLALSDGCYSISDVRNRIKTIFSDDKAAVTFSSVHRAKGDEADRVYILRPELMPHPLGLKEEWSRQQEQNLMYVAWTRSKSELFFVQ